MSIQTREAKIMLAIEAIQSTKKISVRKAATLYEVPESSLRRRMNGHTPRAETRANGHILKPTEEDAIVQYILDLDTRGFPPRIAGVEDMANLLLATRSTRRVGKQWAYRFVNRQPELKTRFTRVYDFQRALCEDTKLIQTWFQLVSNMRAKYGVQDCDFYNFDETGFMMGMISTAMVVTRSDRHGRSKSVQPGNREWATAIECVNADGCCIPPFLIVQGAYHLANWYTESDLPQD
jgi:helix-turn-helix, Psq domain/Tc5 transposase DNA-binding domain